MDKSWIHLSRVSNAYLSGATEFLDFAFTNASDRGRILCPCKNCNNNFWVSRQEAYDHIVCDGFNTCYTHWRFHGEGTSSSMPNLDEASSVVMAKLNEEISQQPGASQNSTTKNDLLSQVMGEDRHGRVYTYGLGPSPSDLWGTTSSQQRMASIAQRRDERYEELHADIVSLKENIAALSSLREAEMSSLKETMVEISSARDAEISSLKETLMKLIAIMNNANNNPPTVFGVVASSNMNQPSSSSSHWVTSRKHSTNKGKTTSCTSAGDVTGVSLTSITKPGVTIAKGVVLSKDPLTKVGGHELGIGFWKVLIHVAIVRDEVLIRPYGRYKTIGDAIGTSVVWPSILCKV